MVYKFIIMFSLGVLIYHDNQTT